MSNEFKELSVHQLQAGQYQPRQDFSQAALGELADSIASQGLIEPIIVREIACQRYEIIAGERRWRAAQLAGFEHVPCLIGQYSDQQACALTLIENIQRQDLNLIEEASGYQRLISEFHFHQDEIAAWVGKSRSHIANLLRLLSLSPVVKNFLIERQLSLGHARMLVGFSEENQCKLAIKAVEEGWSVRFLEQAVKEFKQDSKAPKNSKKDRDIHRLQTILAEQVGAPVEITEEIEGGWIKIKYFNNDTLAGLLERFGLSYD